RRLLSWPWRLRFYYQGGLGALLRRGWPRPHLGLPADAVDRCHGRQPGPDDGGRAAADRAPAPDRLGSLDSGTAPALGRFRVGVLRTSGQLWGTTGFLDPHRRPARPAWLVRTGVAVRHVTT